VADAAEPQSGAAKVRHLGCRGIAEILPLTQVLRLARSPVGLELGQGTGQGVRRPRLGSSRACFIIST